MTSRRLARVADKGLTCDSMATGHEYSSVFPPCRDGTVVLGGVGRRAGSGGPGDVNGAGVSVWRVAVPVFDIRQGWSGVHGVPVAGGSDRRQLIDGTGVGPASIFFALVAAFTQPGGIGPAGGATGSPGLTVIGIFDRAITPGGGTGVIPQQQHVGDPFWNPASPGL